MSEWLCVVGELDVDHMEGERPAIDLSGAFVAFVGSQKKLGKGRDV